MSEEHPEARLLDLIRGPSPGSGRWKRLKNLWEGVGRLSAVVFSVRSVLAEAADRLKPFKAANAVMVVLLLFSFGYFLLVWAQDEEQWAAATLPGNAPVLEASTPSRRGYSHYLRAVKSRDLFGRSRSVVEKKSGPTAAQRSRGLRLMGFIGSGGEQQAVVLDPKTGVTYYLRKGDTIRGLLVETIGKGKMVLTRDGQKVSFSQ